MHMTRPAVSVRFVFESAVFAMSLGGGLSAFLWSPDAGYNVLYRLFAGLVGAIVTPPCLGFVPLDENGSNYLDGRLETIGAFVGLLVAANRQSRMPKTLGDLKYWGPLCRRTQWFLYLVWLIFIPIGTVLGVVGIACLLNPTTASEEPDAIAFDSAALTPPPRPPSDA